MKPLLTLLFLSFVLTASAQTATDGADRADLAERVAQLEKSASTRDKILRALPRISGYVQLGYEYTDNSSSFFIKRVRLTLAGDIVADRLDYRIQIEFASPKVVDVYLNYKALPQLNVKLGQFKLPFSIENTEYPPTRIEFIDYPMALQRLMGFCEPLGETTLSATGRDLGVNLYGGFLKADDGRRIIRYDLGLYNGAGINTRDNNKSKDVAARLMVEPLAGLLISGSYYYGEFGGEYLKRERYAVGACYDRGPVVVRSEWLGGKTGALRSDGIYAMLGWRVGKNVMPAFRYDTFRSDVDDSATRQTNYTVGCSWAPVKHLRCQLDYTYEDYKAGTSRNVLSVMLTGMF